MADDIETKTNGGNDHDDAIVFARSARKHRISYDDIRHALLHRRFSAVQSTSSTRHELRTLVLGPACDGLELELIVISRTDGSLLVIHAMPMRRRYVTLYTKGLP